MKKAANMPAKIGMVLMAILFLITMVFPVVLRAADNENSPTKITDGQFVKNEDPVVVSAAIWNETVKNYFEVEDKVVSGKERTDNLDRFRLQSEVQNADGSISYRYNSTGFSKISLDLPENYGATIELEEHSWTIKQVRYNNEENRELHNVILRTINASAAEDSIMLLQDLLGPYPILTVNQAPAKIIAPLPTINNSYSVRYYILPDGQFFVNPGQARLLSWIKRIDPSGNLDFTPSALEETLKSGDIEDYYFCYLFNVARDNDWIFSPKLSNFQRPWILFKPKVMGTVKRPGIR